MIQPAPTTTHAHNYQHTCIMHLRVLCSDDVFLVSQPECLEPYGLTQEGTSSTVCSQRLHSLGVVRPGCQVLYRHR